MTSAPLSRVEAIARREADSTGRPHVVLNLNRAGAPLYVCRELHEGIQADRIVSRFDPPAPVEAAASVVGTPAPAADVTAYEVDRAEAIHGLGQKSDAELRTLADHFRKVAPLASVASNRQSSEAIVAACERLIARRGAMVPQPAQQQQARARGRSLQPARGERRYVTVRDMETGNVHRVLTSVAQVGVAVVIFIPSNRHRQGALGGMLITHDDIRKAWVFNDEAEARRALSRNGAPGERVIRAELVADPAPAIVPLGGRYVALADGGVEWVADAPTMVPQPAQQQQAKARAAVAAPSDKAVTWTEFWACYAQCATRQYEAGTLPYPRMAPVGMSHSEAGTWLADMASRTVSSGQPFAHDGPVLRAALRSFGQAARTKRDTLAFLAGLAR